jgi:hypothetical protein
MAEEAASFHLKTMESERLIVAAFDAKLVLTRLAPQNGAVELLSTWTTTQRVRSVALFQHQSSKKILLAAAGDGKVVNCYDITSFTLDAVAASGSAPATPPQLVFSYGLHQKKISHVCGADDDIVLGDKFGEVYRIQLAYDEHTSTFSATAAEANLLDDGGDDEDDDENEAGKNNSVKSAPTAVSPAAVTPAGGLVMFGKQSVSFMLQHFSLLTQLYITDCVPRRLLSCDREGHARVSKYPHTFLIDQFLWNDAPQAPVTCIAELADTQCEGNVIVTGDAKGRVTFWCDAVKVVSTTTSLEETSSKTNAASDAGTFKRLAVIDLHAFHMESMLHQSATSSDLSTAAATGVVGLALLHNKAADSFGVLIALDKVDDLFFCPIRDGGFSIEVCSSSITRVPVSRPVVGLVAAGPASALVVQRRGAESSEHSVAILESDGCEDSSRVRVVDVASSPLAAELNTLGFETLDLFAYWRPAAAKDPRAAKLQQQDEDGEGDDNEGESAKKRNRTQ